MISDFISLAALVPWGVSGIGWLFLKRTTGARGTYLSLDQWASRDCQGCQLFRCIGRDVFIAWLDWKSHDLSKGGLVRLGSIVQYLLSKMSFIGNDSECTISSPNTIPILFWRFLCKNMSSDYFKNATSSPRPTGNSKVASGTEVRTVPPGSAEMQWSVCWEEVHGYPHMWKWVWGFYWRMIFCLVLLENMSGYYWISFFGFLICILGMLCYWFGWCCVLWVCSLEILADWKIDPHHVKSHNVVSTISFSWKSKSRVRHRWRLSSMTKSC